MSTAIHTRSHTGECIDACMNCHEICLETIAHCLEKGGAHAEAGHIRLLMDCAQICETSADFMIRGSDLHGRTCRVCAEVCEACAVSCESVADGSQMQSCAEACRRCAEACRQMSAGLEPLRD
jgi:Domain of Unknown Function (DUF326)